MSLAEYLEERSQEICRESDCDLENDEHRCGSYAYINGDLQLLDICLPDYFQGTSESYAAIPLPFYGTDADLAREVQDDFDNQL